MIKKQKIYIYLSLACLTISIQLNFVRSANSQDNLIQIYEHSIRQMIPGFRRIFCENLPEPDKGICVSAPIRIVGSHAFNASTDGRRIYISSGTAMVFDATASAYVNAGELTGSNECFYEYMGNFIQTLLVNTERKKLHLPLRALVGIIEFSEYSEYCSGVNAEGVMSVYPETNSLRVKEIEAAIAFLLLHELGHIVNGDLSEDKSLLSLAQMRERELRADNWALQAASKAEYILFPNLAVYFVGALQGYSMDWEENSDHPLGIRRASIIYNAAYRDLLYNPQRRRMLGGDYAAILESVNSLNQSMTRCLEIVDNGGADCVSK